jgi:NADH:ubiquinone oxidoreductase subunit 6 (subunit J)
MSNDFLDKAVWVLIFGGLLVLSAGLFVRRQDAAFGATLLIGGGLAAALGVLLLWVRSRRKT